MKFNHFLLPNSNKTSNNPDSELARLVTGKGPYLPMSFQSQGSDSVFATEHWQPQGASQYSAVIFYKTYAHSGIWHSKNLQNTECDKLP